MVPTTLHRVRFASLLLGALVSAAGVAAYCAGAMDRLHRLGLDLHFRWVGGWRADPRVVLIDIDDRALQAPTSWPWPRRLHADVVRTLTELGAGSIVLDIIYSEPTAIRNAWHGLTIDRDLDATALPDADAREEDVIDDDEELRRAIADSQRVLLAMFCDFAAPGAPDEQARERAIEQLTDEPMVPATELRSRLNLSTKHVTDETIETWRSAALLLRRFGLSDDELALRRVEGGLPACAELNTAARRLAASWLARRFLKADPMGEWSAFFERSLPDRSPDTISPLHTLLMQAFRAERAAGTALARFGPIEPDVAARLRNATRLVAPLAPFAEAARGVGLVSFDRASPDGVIRRLPIAAVADGKPMPQLGLLAACHANGWACDRLSIRGECVVVGDDDTGKGAPVDPSGSVLLGWVTPPERNRWELTFEHVPASRLLEVASNRRLMRENVARLERRRSDLVRLRHRETPAEFARYAALVRERNERRRLASAGSEQVGPAPNSVDAAEGIEITRFESEALDWLRWRNDLWRNESPRDNAENKDRDEIAALHTALAEGTLERDVAALNASLEARTAGLVADLTPRVANKVCLVGYTASAEADLVSAPIASAMPGVMVHANVINMFLSNRFPRVAPQLFQGAIILLSGMGVTFGARRGSAATGVAILALLTIVWAVASAVLFRMTAVHLDAFVAIVVTGAAWAVVTAYRQATEERSRRNFQRALESYTSPAIAARVADQASPADFAPRPAIVTCFFCDLEGFTPLSERLGPLRTRDVLNPFLAEMTRVLAEHGAIVNKFTGDGVFAFFNCPILRLDDHASAACAAALAAQLALTRLNRQSAWEPPLSMRVGLASGDVFVGDYGGGAKLDYTCIGDTVNLASRLEQANKKLGTRVLVSADTRRLAGDRFQFRGHGEIEVPGRLGRVEVFELTGAAFGGTSSLASVGRDRI